MSGELESALELMLRRIVREEVSALLQIRSDVPHASARSATDMLDPTTAGAEFGFSANTILDWVRKGLLPGHGKGKRLRVQRGDVQLFLSRRDAGEASTDADLDERASQALKRFRPKTR